MTDVPFPHHDKQQSQERLMCVPNLEIGCQAGSEIQNWKCGVAMRINGSGENVFDPWGAEINLDQISFRVSNCCHYLQRASSDEVIHNGM
jgi:hypothetical protein